MSKNKKRYIIYFSMLIFSLFNLTGCMSDKEKTAWVSRQMSNVPEIKVDLDDIAQVLTDREHSSRGGTYYEREASIMLKFKIDTMNVEKNFKPNEIDIKKDLKPEDKSYVNLKFVDTDIVSDKGYSIERGMYNIVVHLPSNYFVREIDNRKHADQENN